MKLKIIKAAVKCIHNYGIEGLSYDQIARIAKSTKSLVAYHFPKKNDLLQLVYKFVFASGQSLMVQKLREIAGAAQPREILKAYFRICQEWVYNDPPAGSVVLTLLTVGSRERETQLRRITHEFRAFGRNRIETMLDNLNDSSQSGQLTSNNSKTAELLYEWLLGRVVILCALRPASDEFTKFIETTWDGAVRILSEWDLSNSLEK